MDKTSYALGINIALQIKQMDLKSDMNVDDFVAGIADTMKGNAPKLSMEECGNILEKYFEEKGKKDKCANESAKADGERYLEQNAKRPEVTVTASGLQYEVLQEGTGRQPKATDTVRCHYEGTLINGTVFDSSYRRNEPCDFGLNQVIAGWTEGVQLMKEGAKYRFHIPYNLAYGERGAGASIPPYAALIFDVELIKVM